MYCCLYFVELFCYFSFRTYKVVVEFYRKLIWKIIFVCVECVFYKLMFNSLTGLISQPYCYDALI